MNHMESKSFINATDEASKVSTEIKPMTFDEVAAIMQSGNSEKLKEVIESGRVSDVDMKNEHLHSLLMVAYRIRYNSIGCVKVLLDHNADINYTYQTHSVLRSACLSGNLDMLNLIIERGVIINDNIISYLFESEELVRDTAIATVLVTNIRDVNFRRIDSRDFLHYAACKAGNATITRMLLESGARYVLGNSGFEFWGRIPIRDPRCRRRWPSRGGRPLAAMECGY